MSLYGLHDTIPLNLGAAPSLKLYLQSGNKWVLEKYFDFQDADELTFGLGPNSNTIFAEAQIEYLPMHRAVGIFHYLKYEDPEELAIEEPITEISYVIVHPQYYGKGYGLEILKRIKPYIRGYTHANMFSQRIFNHLYKVFGLPEKIMAMSESGRDEEIISPMLPEEVNAHLDLNPILSQSSYIGYPRLSNTRNVYAIWK